jgi:hypothetical protein
MERDGTGRVARIEGGARRRHGRGATGAHAHLVRACAVDAHVRGSVHVSVPPGPAGDIYGAGHVATSTSSELLDV